MIETLRRATRPAAARDLPAVLNLGRQMHAEGFFRHVAMDEDKVMAALEQCLASEFFELYEGSEGVDGFLAGHIGEFWFSRELVASDLAFYVRPGKRGSFAAVRLIQGFVAWAKTRGAAEVSIAQSSGVRLEETQRLLTGMGFAYVGGVYKWRLD